MPSRIKLFASVVKFVPSEMNMFTSQMKLFISVMNIMPSEMKTNASQQGMAVF
jgi:hypothetical protein